MKTNELDNTLTLIAESQAEPHHRLMARNIAIAVDYLRHDTRFDGVDLRTAPLPDLVRHFLESQS